MNSYLVEENDLKPCISEQNLNSTVPIEEIGAVVENFANKFCVKKQNSNILKINLKKN